MRVGYGLEGVEQRLDEILTRLDAIERKRD